MLHYQRVLFSDNGTLTDYSKELNDYRGNTVTLPWVAAEDALYIASDFPFNGRYFDISSANAETSSITVQNWFGNAWVDCVDILDYTSALSESNYIRWTTNNIKGWDIELYSYDVTGLTGTNIYNMYWTKITFSADLTASTALNYIGHMFCQQDDLYTKYPDLQSTSLLSNWESGKTTWNEQILTASEDIITDLKNRNVVYSASQILSPSLYAMACIHKTAEIIYSAFHDAYADQAIRAKEYYNQELNKIHHHVDVNASGNLERFERDIKTGYLSR